MALGGAFGFAVGTVWPEAAAQPAATVRCAWPLGIGCLAGGDRPASWSKRADVAALIQSRLDPDVYSTVIQFCVAYVSWFAALAPAGLGRAIGTMAVPVIGRGRVGGGAARAARPGQSRACLYVAGVVAGDAIMTRAPRSWQKGPAHGHAPSLSPKVSPAVTGRGAATRRCPYMSRRRIVGTIVCMQ